MVKLFSKVKNMLVSTLITSKIAEKLLHYFKVFQQGGEGSLSSSSEAE